MDTSPSSPGKHPSHSPAGAASPGQEAPDPYEFRAPSQAPRAAPEQGDVPGPSRALPNPQDSRQDQHPWHQGWEPGQALWHGPPLLGPDMRRGPEDWRRQQQEPHRALRPQQHPHHNQQHPHHHHPRPCPSDQQQQQQHQHQYHPYLRQSQHPERPTATTCLPPTWGPAGAQQRREDGQGHRGPGPGDEADASPAPQTGRAAVQGLGAVREEVPAGAAGGSDHFARPHAVSVSPPSQHQQHHHQQQHQSQHHRQEQAPAPLSLQPPDHQPLEVSASCPPTLGSPRFPGARQLLRNSSSVGSTAAGSLFSPTTPAGAGAGGRWGSFNSRQAPPAPPAADPTAIAAAAAAGAVSAPAGQQGAPGGPSGSPGDTPASTRGPEPAHPLPSAFATPHAFRPYNQKAAPDTTTAASQATAAAAAIAAAGGAATAAPAALPLLTHSAAQRHLSPEVPSTGKPLPGSESGCRPPLDSSLEHWQPGPAVGRCAAAYARKGRESAACTDEAEAEVAGVKVGQGLGTDAWQQAAGSDTGGRAGARVPHRQSLARPQHQQQQQQTQQQQLRQDLPETTMEEEEDARTETVATDGAEEPGAEGEVATELEAGSGLGAEAAPLDEAEARGGGRGGCGGAGTAAAAAAAVAGRARLGLGQHARLPTPFGAPAEFRAGSRLGWPGLPSQPACTGGTTRLVRIEASTAAGGRCGERLPLPPLPQPQQQPQLLLQEEEGSHSGASPPAPGHYHHHHHHRSPLMRAHSTASAASPLPESQPHGIHTSPNPSRHAAARSGGGEGAASPVDKGGLDTLAETAAAAAVDAEGARARVPHGEPIIAHSFDRTSFDSQRSMPHTQPQPKPQVPAARSRAEAGRVGRADVRVPDEGHAVRQPLQCEQADDDTRPGGGSQHDAQRCCEIEDQRVPSPSLSPPPAAQRDAGEPNAPGAAHRGGPHTSLRPKLPHGGDPRVKEEQPARALPQEQQAQARPQGSPRTREGPAAGTPTHLVAAIIKGPAPQAAGQHQGLLAGDTLPAAAAAVTALQIPIPAPVHVTVAASASKRPNTHLQLPTGRGGKRHRVEPPPAVPASLSHATASAGTGGTGTAISGAQSGATAGGSAEGADEDDGGGGGRAASLSLPIAAAGRLPSVTSAAGEPGAAGAAVALLRQRRTVRLGEFVLSLPNEVVCEVLGLFHPQRYMDGWDCVECPPHSGVFITRSHFEKVGGAVTAKWYRSIRVLPHLEPLGDWLLRNGLPVFKGGRRRRRTDRPTGAPDSAGSPDVPPSPVMATGAPASAGGPLPTAAAAAPAAGYGTAAHPSATAGVQVPSSADAVVARQGYGRTFPPVASSAPEPFVRQPSVRDELSYDGSGGGGGGAVGDGRGGGHARAGAAAVVEGAIPGGGVSGRFLAVEDGDPNEAPDFMEYGDETANLPVSGAQHAATTANLLYTPPPPQQHAQHAQPTVPCAPPRRAWGAPGHVRPRVTLPPAQGAPSRPALVGTLGDVPSGFPDRESAPGLGAVSPLAPRGHALTPRQGRPHRTAGWPVGRSSLYPQAEAPAGVGLAAGGDDVGDGEGHGYAEGESTGASGGEGGPTVSRGRRRRALAPDEEASGALPGSAAAAAAVALGEQGRRAHAAWAVDPFTAPLPPMPGLGGSPSSAGAADGGARAQQLPHQPQPHQQHQQPPPLRALHRSLSGEPYLYSGPPSPYGPWPAFAGGVQEQPPYGAWASGAWVGPSLTHGSFRAYHSRAAGGAPPGPGLQPRPYPHAGSYLAPAYPQPAAHSRPVPHEGLDTPGAAAPPHAVGPPPGRSRSALSHWGHFRSGDNSSQVAGLAAAAAAGPAGTGPGTAAAAVPARSRVPAGPRLQRQLGSGDYAAETQEAVATGRPGRPPGSRGACVAAADSGGSGCGGASDAGAGDDDGGAGDLQGGRPPPVHLPHPSLQPAAAPHRPLRDAPQRPPQSAIAAAVAAAAAATEAAAHHHHHHHELQHPPSPGYLPYYYSRTAAAVPRPAPPLPPSPGWRPRVPYPAPGATTARHLQQAYPHPQPYPHHEALPYGPRRSASLSLPLHPHYRLYPGGPVVARAGQVMEAAEAAAAGRPAAPLGRRVLHGLLPRAAGDCAPEGIEGTREGCPARGATSGPEAAWEDYAHGYTGFSRLSHSTSSPDTTQQGHHHYHYHAQPPAAFAAQQQPSDYDASLIHKSPQRPQQQQQQQQPSPSASHPSQAPHGTRYPYRVQPQAYPSPAAAHLLAVHTHAHPNVRQLQFGAYGNSWPVGEAEAADALGASGRAGPHVTAEEEQQHEEQQDAEEMARVRRPDRVRLAGRKRAAPSKEEHEEVEDG